jgi:hypothetical protein
MPKSSFVLADGFEEMEAVRRNDNSESRDRIR